MTDNPPRATEDLVIQGVVPYRMADPPIPQRLQGAVPPAPVETQIEQPGSAAVEAFHGLAQVKIVEHHHPRPARQPVEHIPVIGGVAKVVQHPVEVTAVFEEPVVIPDPAVLANPGVGYL